MLNEKLPNSKYCYDSHSCQTENLLDDHQKVKLFALKRNVNNANGMAKLGIPLSILGLGVINSGIGRNQIGEASDMIQELDINNKINHIPSGKIVDKNYDSSMNYVAKKVNKIRRLQSATLGCDIATLFIIPAVITIPTSLILNTINIFKTGKLKNKLNEFVKYGYIKIVDNR